MSFFPRAQIQKTRKKKRGSSVEPDGSVGSRHFESAIGVSEEVKQIIKATGNDKLHVSRSGKALLEVIVVVVVDVGHPLNVVVSLVI